MKNYVKNLTEEDVEKLLDITGYELATDVENPKTRELLPAIERYDDEDTAEHNIFVRCIKRPSETDTKLALAMKNTTLYKLMMTINSLPLYSNFLGDTGFIIISDFEFNEYFMSNMLNKQDKKTDNNLEKFTTYMVDKFGDEYINDYNAFADEYNKKLEEEKVKQKQEEKETKTKETAQTEEEIAIEEEEETKEF